jgi:hypothetical protein
MIVEIKNLPLDPPVFVPYTITLTIGSAEEHAVLREIGWADIRIPTAISVTSGTSSIPQEHVVQFLNTLNAGLKKAGKS